MIDRIGWATTAEATQSIGAIDRQVEGFNEMQGLVERKIEMKSWSELFVLKMWFVYKWDFSSD